MYSGTHAVERGNQAAFIMAATGEVVTHSEFDRKTNRLAHFLRQQGMERLDHYSIFMENNATYLEACGAGERAGLYYTCINSYLTAEELTYILNNSESRILIASETKLPIVKQALEDCPGVGLCLVVSHDIGKAVNEEDISNTRYLDYRKVVAECPDTAIDDETLGTSMLYSSGTTGRPKGIIRPLPVAPPEDELPIFEFLSNLWQYRADMIYLSPAPLYHSAPQAAVGLTIRAGGTAIIMERFDPEEYMALIEKYQVSHSQLVPTMFSRMLKLPAEARNRHNLDSLETIIHAAAPCPAQVKEQMIEWWGPIIHEYYGATEGLGFTACNSEEWLAHRGTVGRVLLGEIHILEEDGTPTAQGKPGEIWFKTANEFSYFNDKEKTAEAISADGTMSTVGDIGYLDEDGYLYLTDRATFMIISGGVNIYPQESENLLITHPKVADAAVFGVPHVDLGEEVKAVIELMPGISADSDLEEELIQFCHEHLSRQKCPRSIDFEDKLPRLPTGKLYKRQLRDRYWADKSNKI